MAGQETDALKNEVSITSWGTAESQLNGAKRRSKQRTGCFQCPTKEKVRLVLWQRHFVISLICFVIVALAWPMPGASVDGPIQFICPVIVFVLTGLYMQTKDVMNAFKHWFALSLGVVIILGLVPTLGFAAMTVPYRTLELQNGFALFIVMPTALGTVTLLTEQCDGNHVMATLLGIITNLVGPVSVPAFLDAVLGAGGDIDVKHMMWELVVIVLVPLAVGKGLQRVPAVSKFCIKYQTGFKLFQSIVLNIMPWTALSRAAPDLQRLSSADLLDLFGTCIILAFVLTAMALLITFFLPIATPDKKAILICTAMKTVSIPLAIIALLPDNSGDDGLLSLVTVVAFIMLLLIGSIMSAILARVPQIGTRSAEEAETVMTPNVEIGLVSDHQLFLPTEKSMRQMSSVFTTSQMLKVPQQHALVGAAPNTVVANPLASINAAPLLPGAVRP